jgi:hypothetical protein
MQHLRYRSSALSLLALTVLVTQVGCVQRNLEYNCQGLREVEMKMTPTRLQLEAVSYGFREESGAWRTYADAQTGIQIRFNPSSGQLILDEQRWTCRKYGALLEKAQP